MESTDSQRTSDDASKEKVGHHIDDVSDDITVVNNKDNLRSFIERSPLGIQFGIIVLFYLASEYMNSNKKQQQHHPSSQSDANTTAVIATKELSSFSFTSKEFLDTYSQLALEMGLIKYLVRHIAFTEFILTLEYLTIIREEESSARYQFKINFEDLRWMASTALQQIVGGRSLSSPEIFYPPPPSETLPPRTLRPSKKTINPPTLTNTERVTSLVKELSQNIFSLEENEQNRGGGTSKIIDDAARPRSRDYGLYRPYFQHRVPPTQYSFRPPNEDEEKRIYHEFIENTECIVCREKILLDYFDVWIGEPLEDTEQKVSDQRVTEILGNMNPERSDTTIQEIISHNYHPTERELLSFSYGIIPMDGRDAFIVFAKPRQSCSKCGTDPASSVSLMPKY